MNSGSRAAKLSQAGLIQNGGLCMNHVADDVPVWKDHYKLMTKEQLNIPGLHMMGHARFLEVYDKLDTHFHANLEFVVLLNGRQKYLVNEKQYMLYGNEMFMTYPYEQHGNGNALQDVSEFLWFQIDLSSAGNFLGLVPPRSDYLYQQFLNYRTRIKKIQEGDPALLKKAFYLLSSRKISSQSLGYGYLLEFILKNICTQDGEMKKEDYSKDIETAVSYIHQNLFSDLNIDVIAKQCGLSPSRFKAKFKQQIGVTPHNYINSLKIDSAKVYLKDEKRSITEISYLLNFSSSNHFASVFKKYTGYTPSEFRDKRFPDIY